MTGKESHEVKVKSDSRDRQFPYKYTKFPQVSPWRVRVSPQGLSVVKTVHTQIHSRLVVQGTSCSKSSALWKVLLGVAGLSWTQQVNQLGIENLLTLYKRQLVSSEIILFLIANCWSQQCDWEEQCHLLQEVGGNPWQDQPLFRGHSPLDTGGEGAWKPTKTSWVHCRLWLRVPATYLLIAD